MTYLIVTDSLIDNLENLNLDLQYKKISKDSLNLNEQSSLFEDPLYKFVYDSFFTYKNLQDNQYNFSLRYIFQIKKSNLQKFQNIENLTVVHNSAIVKEKYPWDLSNIIFNKNKNLDSDLLFYFSNKENNFRNFFNFFTKEVFRLKLLLNVNADVVSKILNEKKDYKYEKADGLLKKLSANNLDEAINLVYKLEEKMLKASYNQENSKRFIIAIKQKLQV
ncbi:hypothetical protein OAJ33_01630 [Acidimicrobiaceae bacterium]|nr:hypothetical protein [Acidimicrobiaceae bacterium]